MVSVRSDRAVRRVESESEIEGSDASEPRQSESYSVDGEASQDAKDPVEELKKFYEIANQIYQSAKARQVILDWKREEGRGDGVDSGSWSSYPKRWPWDVSWSTTRHKKRKLNH